MDYRLTKKQIRILKIRMWLAIGGLLVTLAKLGLLLYRGTLER